MHFPAWSTKVFLQTFFWKIWAQFLATYNDSTVWKMSGYDSVSTKFARCSWGLCIKEKTYFKASLMDVNFSLPMSKNLGILWNEATWTGLSSSSRFLCVAVYPFPVKHIHMYLLYQGLCNLHAFDHHLFLEHSVEICFCCHTLIWTETCDIWVD